MLNFQRKRKLQPEQQTEESKVVVVGDDDSIELSPNSNDSSSSSSSSSESESSSESSSGTESKSFILPSLSTFPSKPSKFSELLQKGSFDFSLALYKALKKPDDNFVVSPFSLTSALAMCLMGARNKTREEISKTLFGSVVAEDKLDSLAKEFRMVVKGAVKNNAEVLSAANFMYSKIGYPILPNFAQTLEKNFAAEIKAVDFKKTKETAKLINNDISNATNGKIPEIISASDLKPDFERLILANAVYFKGLWEKRFSEDDTEKRKFTLPSGEIIKVNMMEKFGSYLFGVCKQLKCKALMMPYADCNIEMLLLLPDKDSSLEFLEDNLTQPLLLDLLNKMDFPNVNVRLPRFKIDSNFDLNAHLNKLGISKAFEDEADFTGISSKASLSDEGLKISQVIQKAGIEVNEKGTEAYAATLKRMIKTTCGTHSPVKIKHFHANRPFMFLLVSVYQGKHLILFMGSVKNPLD